MPTTICRAGAACAALFVAPLPCAASAPTQAPPPPSDDFAARTVWGSLRKLAGREPPAVGAIK